MKTIYFVIAIPLFLLSASLDSQPIDSLFIKGMEPRNIGPAGMSGRVTAIDVDLRDPDRIFAGTASGGIWLSENGGISWEPIFDKAPIQSIGSIAIDQSNPSVIYAGTGEGNPRNSHNSGAGVYKSLDGGRNWTFSGLKNTKLIHRLIIHPDEPDIIYAGALGSAWGPNPERGIFRSDDGGKSWRNILFVNDSTGIGDLVMDPSNPNKLIAAMWEFGRKPWTFQSGGKGSGLYITWDGGENWKKLSSRAGLPKGDLGRIGLAIAPSSPNIIYALVEAKENGLYKSVDGGFKWSLVSKENIGNRPFYYADIFVDPKNENRIFNLYSYVSRSEDGGKTFTVIAGYSAGGGVHPDHHAFWIHPDDPDYIIEGNDGGLNISRDGGDSWRFVSNLPLAQFYHINIDMDVPYNVYGGMQDNGSWVGPSTSWVQGGITNHEWQELYFGDGFDVVPRPDDSRYVYAMSQGGNVALIDRETGHSRFIKPVHPDGVPLRYNWNAAIAQDPYSDCGLYFGSQFVHYSPDCGLNWEIISPDLTSNDTSKQKQAVSGGLTIDATQAENFCSILAIAPSPLEKGVIWASTDDGYLHITRNGGESWTSLSGRLPGYRKGSWIPQIELSPQHAGEAFVIVNDYQRNHWDPYLYHTDDYGESWSRLVGKGDVLGHTLAVVQDPESESLLFLGTDQGLYLSIDKGDSWTQWKDGFPAVSTTDLKIHPREADLVIGTFGRAAWVIDDIRPLRKLADSKGALVKKPFGLFETQDAILASIRSYEGIRFKGGAEFRGDNRPRGALINVWVGTQSKKGSAEKAGGEKTVTEGRKGGVKAGGGRDKNKVRFMIYDSEGDTVRNFSREMKAGLNRTWWRLDRNTVRRSGYRDPRSGQDPSGGRTVLPGEYKVVAHYMSWKDSTMIKLLPDPRLAFDEEAQLRKEQLLDEMYEMTEEFNAVVERLKEMKRTVGLVNGSFVNAPDSIRDMMKEEGKQMVASIDSLLTIFLGPRESKGIDGVTVRWSRKHRGAFSYIQSAAGKESNLVSIQMASLKVELDVMVGQLDSLVEEKWTAYRTLADQHQHPVFKDYEPLKK